MEVETEVEFDLEAEDFNLDQIIDSAVGEHQAPVYLIIGLQALRLPPMKQHLP